MLRTKESNLQHLTLVKDSTSKSTNFQPKRGFILCSRNRATIDDRSTNQNKSLVNDLEDACNRYLGRFSFQTDAEDQGK